MIPDWLISTGAGLIVWIGIPALFIFSAILPFLIVKKVLKKPLTPASITISLIIAGGLVYLDYRALYWGFAWLQGQAACSLYGC